MITSNVGKFSDKVNLLSKDGRHLKSVSLEEINKKDSRNTILFVDGCAYALSIVHTSVQTADREFENQLNYFEIPISVAKVLMNRLDEFKIGK